MGAVAYDLTRNMRDFGNACRLTKAPMIGDIGVTYWELVSMRDEMIVAQLIDREDTCSQIL